MIRTECEDQELIYMIHQGSEEALEILLNRYERIYKAIVYSFQYHFKDSSQAKDLFLQCRLILYLATLSYREDKGAQFSYYFKMLSEQAAINEVRKLKCKQRLNDYEALSMDMYVNETQSIYLVDTFENSHCEYDPSWCLELKELGSIYRKEIEKLTPFEQQVWNYKFHGYSYKQIAAVLNVSIKKVDNTIQKLKITNRKLIEKYRS
ncbi:MAG: hypothetical protein RSC93_12390 [Erysipelotrichaceae bacterium]